MKQIYLKVKRPGKRAENVAKRVTEFLARNGVRVNQGDIHPKDEAIVVVGGDGTLLHVASLAYSRQLPLLGINAGGLGFLTEVHIDEMEESLKRLINRHFELDERMVLSVRVHSPKKHSPIREYVALNEAVITKGALSKIIQINTWADDLFLTTYKGDGLIVSTATGSTGYNLSAGGPIVYPNLDVIILTPICPFALSSRPLILSGNTTIRIEVKDIKEEVCLDIDGQVGIHLEKGLSIVIKRAEKTLKLIRNQKRDYFTILREKLGWTKGINILQDRK